MLQLPKFGCGLWKPVPDFVKQLKSRLSSAIFPLEYASFQANFQGIKIGKTIVKSYQRNFKTSLDYEKLANNCQQ